MTPQEQAQRDAILARLIESRAEICRLLEPPAEALDESTDAAGDRPAFPRSRIMQALMSGRGLGALGAVAGGLLLARPALAWRLIRLLPTSAVARALLVRLVRSVGASDKPRASRRAARERGEAPP